MNPDDAMRLGRWSASPRGIVLNGVRRLMAGSGVEAMNVWTSGMVIVRIAEARSNGLLAENSALVALAF